LVIVYRLFGQAYHEGSQKVEAQLALAVPPPPTGDAPEAA
jgi:hypothetical protein